MHPVEIPQSWFQNSQLILCMVGYALRLHVILSLILKLNLEMPNQLGMYYVAFSSYVNLARKLKTVYVTIVYFKPVFGNFPCY